MVLRIGGVPENVNAPIYRLVDSRRDLFTYREFPNGTGAMVDALNLDELDVVVALTEGLIRAIAQGGKFRLLGMFTESPLVWGVHVSTRRVFDADELSHARFAISRPGSGSHLMAVLEGKRRGWKGLQFVEVEDLHGARVALAEGRADVFLWEKYTTKPIVDQGEWVRIDEWATPWPGFAIAVHDDAAQHRQDEVDAFMRLLRSSVDELLSLPEKHSWIATRFQLQVEDVKDWASTNVWACSSGVSAHTIQPVIELLKDAELIDETNPHELVAPEYLRP